MEKLWGGTVSVQIIAQLNLFEKTLKTFKCEPCTITKILEKIDTNKTVNTGWRVLINDNPVTDFNTKTNDGDTVYIKLVPEGDNQEAGIGMKVGGVLLTALGVAISFASFGAAAPLGAALIGSGIGLFTGGIALYNLDIPNMDREEPKQDPSIRGSRNQARPYGYVPVLLGKRRIYADLAMTRYTWVDAAGDQYLYQLLCCGQKDVEIDKNTFKIGETLVKDYSASKNIDDILAGTDNLISLEVCHGTLPNTIQKCVHEEQLNAVLKNKTEEGQDGSIVRTTPANTTEINVDVFFFNGLGKYNQDGNLESTSVELGIWYKRADQDDSQYVSLGYFNGNTNVISGNELKTKRLTVSKAGLQPASWTVKVSRVTADSDNNKVVDTVYVGSIRSIKDEKPIREEIVKDLTLIALKIKASEKLSNYVEELNFIAQSKMPVYTGNGTGSSAWTNSKTSNPASAVLYALQGNMSQQKLEDTEIDFYALEKLYQWCEQHKYECNAYISDSMPISQLLSAIGSTCRAEILRLNGKITVNQDIAKNTAVQLFTPRNSHGYSESLSLADLPDAIALKFDDEESGFAENELKIYNTPDGNQITEPQIVQECQLFGVTNSVQARKLGMYKYAVSQNRPLIHKFSVDFEYMLCSKGDRIRYAGDIALAGITQGRIVNVLKNDSDDVIGIESDELIPMEDGFNYALRVRLSSGESILEKVITAESGKTVFFENALTNSEIQKGNLFAFGTIGNESVDLIITDIQCGDNLSADITAVDYAPEIFGVDEAGFVLPDYEPKITDIPSVVDAGISVNEWQTWITYYDGIDKPNKPTGDGNSNGWHRIPTSLSMWTSSKTAKDIYSGEWGNPVPTNQQLVDQLISGDGIDSMAPDVPSQIVCTAQKEGLQLNWVVSATGLKNDIQKYVVEKNVNGVITEYTTSSSSLFYAFNRNVDGYPEKKDLSLWQFRIKAVNIYDKESDWSDYFGINTSDYLTWQVPPVTVESFVADKNELRFSWNCNTDLTYGTVRFDYNIYYEESLVKSKTNVIANNDTYTFDRDTDGYPEKPNVIVSLPENDNTKDISKYSLKIIAKTLENSNTTESDKDLNYNYYGTWIPPKISNIKAVADKDQITVETLIQTNTTDYGTPYSYVFQLSKNRGEDWLDEVFFDGAVWTYVFDRAIDGYPEKEDLEKWRIRAKAISIADKRSSIWAETEIKLDSYGTWILSEPQVSVKVSDRTVTLIMSQIPRADGKFPYGNIRYNVQVQRPDIDYEAEWFKPAEALNPYPTETEANEENYKEGTGSIDVSQVHIQIMPLKGQGLNNIVDTLYRFKVKAISEAFESQPVIKNAIALCSSIRDLVKANETAKEAYFSMLSALSVNLGNISQGSLSGNDNNKWDLSSFTDDKGHLHYEGEFRAGGKKQYIHIEPILDSSGQVTGEYNIYFKVGSFEITSVASTINGDIVVMADNNSLDRTRITPTGTYYEHRESVDSEWITISQMRADGIKTQSVYSEKSMIISNMDIAERRKIKSDIGIPYLSDSSEVYHFDTDLFNQYGQEEAPVNSIGEVKLADQYNMSAANIDFTPAILAVAPYSETGRSLYGQFNLIKEIGNTNKYTVDFWMQYIWAEDQVLFDIGSDNDKVKLVIQNDEVYLNTPLEDEPPLNIEQTRAGEVVVLNEPAASSSFIQHYGSSNLLPSEKHLKTLTDLGIEFKNNSWLHVGIVLTDTTLEVYLNDKKVTFARYNNSSEKCTVVLNELQNTFILDELMIDSTVQESFDSFAKNTVARIPWGALDKNKKHFILETENLVSNIFDSPLFRQKAIELLQEKGLI